MVSKTDILHLITWAEWSDQDIKSFIELASKIKTNPAKFRLALENKSVALLFEKTSTRTRVSFELATVQMGGHPMFLAWANSNFQLTEVEFEARYLSENIDLIMARVKNHEELLKIKNSSKVPVVNGCCNLYHPSQALADILTILEDSKRKPEEIKICYVGVHNNVLNSLIHVTSALGIQLKIVTPISNSEDHCLKALERGKSKATLSWENNLESAVEDVDYLYTDTWVNMEFFNDPVFMKEKELRIKTMLPYQINAELMKKTKAKIMHDMPIHLGYEITKEVVDSDRSIIFEQAKNRLYSAKAILYKLLNP